MATSEEYSRHMQEAQHLLMEGEAREAFRTFRLVLRYPGMVSDEAELVEALELFAGIAREMGGDALAEVARAAAEAPDDVGELYRLGYELIEYGLPGLAATVLARAHLLAPDDEAVLTELSVALEEEMLFAEACRMLRGSPALLEQSFLCRYLLAFNAVMSGDLATARELAPDLAQTHGDDETQRFMAARIEEMLGRADAIAGASALDGRDLRGWHFVVNGGLLLHLSPFGFDEGMNGRYAYVHDSEARCLEGIRRLRAVLEQQGVTVSRVFALPDAKSAVLAEALAREVGCAVVPWPEEGTDEPGVIVAYDLGGLDGPVLATVREHRPGQVLWAHAQNWTDNYPVAADVVTFLYQDNVSPWEVGLRVTEDKGVIEDDADETETAGTIELATRLLGAALEPEALDDLPALLKLAKAAGAWQATGNRGKQWAGSPVPSSRFW